MPFKAARQPYCTSSDCSLSLSNCLYILSPPTSTPSSSILTLSWWPCFLFGENESNQKRISADSHHLSNPPSRPFIHTLALYPCSCLKQYSFLCTLELAPYLSNITDISFSRLNHSQGLANMLLLPAIFKIKRNFHNPTTTLISSAPLCTKITEELSILMFPSPPILVCCCSVRPNIFVTLWTVALQALQSMWLSRKYTGVGCHVLLQGIFPTQGSHSFPALTGRFFTAGSPILA